MTKIEICMFCKSKVTLGSHDFIARIGDQVVIIKDLRALVCEQCGEAYYEKEAMDKIEIVQNQIDHGTFIAHPLDAKQINASEIVET